MKFQFLTNLFSFSDPTTWHHSLVWSPKSGPKTYAAGSIATSCDLLNSLLQMQNSTFVMPDITSVYCGQLFMPPITFLSCIIIAKICKTSPWRANFAQKRISQLCKDLGCIVAPRIFCRKKGNQKGLIILGSCFLFGKFTALVTGNQIYSSWQLDYHNLSRFWIASGFDKPATHTQHHAKLSCVLVLFLVQNTLVKQLSQEWCRNSTIPA